MMMEARRDGKHPMGTCNAELELLMKANIFLREYAISVTGNKLNQKPVSAKTRDKENNFATRKT